MGSLGPSSVERSALGDYEHPLGVEQVVWQHSSAVMYLDTLLVVLFA